MKIPSYLNPSKRQGQLTLLTIIVVLFVFCIKMLPINYQENDDYVYSRIMSGVYSGTPSALTVYEGYLYGLFVSALYRVFPNTIEWYIVVFHFLYILSFVVLACKMLQSKASDYLKYCVLGIGVFMQLYLILSPQFTILAGELALVAAVCLTGKPSKCDFFTAVVFILLSSQLRIQALLMVFAPMMPLLFFPLQMKKKSYWLKAAIVFTSIVVALCINKISNKVYYQDADWSYYSEYNTPRGIIEQNYCKIQAADLIEDPIKKKEYINLCNAGLIDGKILTIEEMNECAQYVKSKSTAFFKMNVLPYIFGLNAHCFYLVFIWLFGLFLYAIRKREWTVMAIILSSTLLFLVELLYCMTTSWVKERIIICFIMYIFVIAIVCTYRLLNEKAMKFCSLPLSIFLACTYSYKSYNREKEVNENLNSSMKVNTLLESLPYDKVHAIGVSCFAECYHVQSTPFTQKVLGKGWLNNIPLHSKYYNGYESLLDRIPIILTPERIQNISDIEIALKNKGIECTREFLHKDNEFWIVLLKKANTTEIW